MKNRPLIGITMRVDLSTRRFYLGRDYSEAIAGLGGLSVHIPLIPERALIKEQLDRLDGLLLPGSDSDVDPYRYGQQPHQKLGTVLPEKDETDLMALEIAEQKNIPVLGICFGMQSLNVSRRGTLIQDIQSQLPDAIKHQQGMPLERLSHKVIAVGEQIEEESIFNKILKEAGLEKEFFTNSHHHQSVDQIGVNLRAAGHAEDGIIECIEDIRNGRFVLGVQWHPELNWKNDKLSQTIFRSFLKAC